MPYFVYDRDEQLIKYALTKLPYAGGASDINKSRAIGVMQTMAGPLSAVVIFSNHHEEFKSIQVSVVIDNPHGMTKGVWRRLFAYPFTQLGVNRLEVTVPASNLKSMALVEKLGFVREGVLRRFLGTDDLIVFSLLRNEAERWLNDKSIQNTETARAA